MFRVPEQHRKTTGMFATNATAGNNGVFEFKLPDGVTARAIASNGHGWEHVSVTVYDGLEMEMPTWEEMCQIKDIFWEKTDVVMQLHPAESDYVNNHPTCLHLWRPNPETNPNTIPTPPPILVGIPGLKLK